MVLCGQVSCLQYRKYSKLLDVSSASMIRLFLHHFYGILCISKYVYLDFWKVLVDFLLSPKVITLLA